jgi:hypothetical protein
MASSVQGPLSGSAAAAPFMPVKTSIDATIRDEMEKQDILAFGVRFQLGDQICIYHAVSASALNPSR